MQMFLQRVWSVCTWRTLLLRGWLRRISAWGSPQGLSLGFGMFAADLEAHNHLGVNSALAESSPSRGRGAALRPLVRLKFPISGRTSPSLALLRFLLHAVKGHSGCIIITSF